MYPVRLVTAVKAFAALTIVLLMLVVAVAM